MHEHQVGGKVLKILFLTSYYKPDLSAGSFRATGLVDALRKIMPNNSSIDVITTLPNRYLSFTADAAEAEDHDGLKIYRIALPNHKSGMIDQSRMYLTFVRKALKKVVDRDYDLVFATSGRLMTAVLAAWIARKKGAKLYLDLRDIFVDTIKDVLPRKITWLAKPFFSVFEKLAVSRADKVNLVSAGFSEYFSTRYPQQRFSYFTNGIDDEFLAAAPTRISVLRGVADERPLTVLYAGNLGEGQGLHKLIPELAKKMGSRVHFRIIGDGGRKRALEVALLECGVTNVELSPPIKRDELLEAYRGADVLFLHLNDYEAFKKVLPSKIFEYAALGKPVWAGVSGYAAEFIRSEVTNAAVFQPCDVEGAMQSFDELILQDAPRTAFVAKYARSNICLKMAEDILAVASGEC